VRFEGEYLAVLDAVRNDEENGDGGVQLCQRHRSKGPLYQRRPATLSLCNAEVVARSGYLPIVLRRRVGHYMKRLKRKRFPNPRNTKRSIKIDGHPTSVTLEDAFWNALKDIATTRNVPVLDLIATINKAREHSNLSSVLRLFVLDHYRALAEHRADQPHA
jgi:predicted DNA-binding ribbon-helix-helix protein